LLSFLDQRKVVGERKTMRTIALLLLSTIALSAAPFAPMPPTLTNGPAFNGVPLLASHRFVRQKYGASMRWTKITGSLETIAGDIKGETKLKILGQDITAAFYFFQVAADDYRLQMVRLSMSMESGSVIVTELLRKYGTGEDAGHDTWKWKMKDGFSIHHIIGGLNRPDLIFYQSKWGTDEVNARTKRGASPDI